MVVAIAKSRLESSVEVSTDAQAVRLFDDSGGYEAFRLTDGGATLYGDDRSRGGVAFIDVASGEVSSVLSVGTIGEALVSPDGSRVAVQGWDDRPYVRLYSRSGQLLGEDRRLKMQHARIAFTGDSQRLVIAHSWFSRPWPLHIFDRDGNDLGDFKVDVDPSRLATVGPTSIAAHGAWNGMQFIDAVARAKSEIIGHDVAAVYTLAVDGDRVIAGSQTGLVMLSSLPGTTAAWPSTESLLDARLEPLAALVKRLKNRLAKARSGAHKRDLEAQIQATQSTLQKPEFMSDRGAIFPGVGGELLDLTLAGDDIVAASRTDVVRFSMATLREDVVLASSPAGGLHVSLTLRSRYGRRLLVEISHKRRELWVIDMGQRSIADPATTRATKPKTASKSTSSATKSSPETTAKTPARHASKRPAKEPSTKRGTG